MTQMLFDSVAVNNIRKTRDGYIVGEANVARTGIQVYLASELGLTDRDPNTLIKVYRPQESVFSQDSMSTYAHRPLTLEHPEEHVTSENWKKYSVGQTGNDVIRDGEFVRIPMMLMDKDAIAAWEKGTKELSMGYTAEIEMKDGVAPDGQQYDAIQKNLIMNHLALVPHARGGNQLRLGDNKPGNSPKKPEDAMSGELKTVVLGDKAVQVAVGDIAAIEQFKVDSKKAFDDADAAHKTVVAAKDGELAKKDAEIESLKKQVLSDADLDKLVKDRGDLIATAKSIADKDYAGKAPAEIRKIAVSAKLGDAAIAGKSDEYIAARFDILAEDAAKDPVRKAIQSHTTTHSVNDNGYAESVRALQMGANYKAGGEQ